MQWGAVVQFFFKACWCSDWFILFTADVLIGSPISHVSLPWANHNRASIKTNIKVINKDNRVYISNMQSGLMKKTTCPPVSQSAWDDIDNRVCAWNHVALSHLIFLGELNIRSLSLIRNNYDAVIWLFDKMIDFSLYRTHFYVNTRYASKSFNGNKTLSNLSTKIHLTKLQLSGERYGKGY